MTPEYTATLAKFRETQEGLQKMIRDHAALESQLNENSMVEEVRVFGHGSRDPLAKLVSVFYEQELKRLGEAESVFKLCGTVLIKQDKAEAAATIESRLKFIQTEL